MLAALRAGRAMDNSKIVRELEECQKTVQQLEEQTSQLEEENRHLRQAAGVFGQLAERLNVTLREERRKADDRRAQQRNGVDRRHEVSADVGAGNHTDEW
jgi:hypothetical protein